MKKHGRKVVECCSTHLSVPTKKLYRRKGA